MLLIDEQIADGDVRDPADGATRTYLVVVAARADDPLDATRIGVVETRGAARGSQNVVTGVLPGRAIAAVMRRYGRELDPDRAREGDVQDRLTLVDCVLERLRFRARVDASSRDYLVWREPGRPALAALSNGVAAALRHLASRGRGGSGPAR